RVTPSRARIALYCMAVGQNELSRGPALIVMLLGGAGSTSQTVSPIASAQSSAIGRKNNAKSCHETETKRAWTRCIGLAGGFDPDPAAARDLDAGVGRRGRVMCRQAPSQGRPRKHQPFTFLRWPCA